MGAQVSSSDGCCSSDPDAVSPAFAPSLFGSFACLACHGCGRDGPDGLTEVEVSTATVFREANDETQEDGLRFSLNPVFTSSRGRAATSSRAAGVGYASSSRAAGVEFASSSSSLAAAPNDKDLRPAAACASPGSWFAEGGSYKSREALAESLRAGDAVLVWGSWLAEQSRLGRP
ncbi:unnamed protein product, partial [Polarella glacialis]